MNEKDPIYLMEEGMNTAESRYGIFIRERLEAGEVVKLDGKFYKKSPFNNASSLP